MAVVAGAALLWPSQQKVDIPLPFQNAAGGAVTTEAGHVLSSKAAPCGEPIGRRGADRRPRAGAGRRCPVRARAGGHRLRAQQGAKTVLEFSGGPGQPNLAAGDHIRITRQVDPAGATTYAFYDYERTWPLIALAAAFAVVIVAVARWRGLRALFGIVVAFLVLVVFLLPALRDGAAAIPVALVASAAILYAVIYLAHGVSLRTSAALLGTLTSLLLAAVLSWGAIELAHLTGLSEDQNNEVAAYLGNVSITGLLLAGFIIGSLGVLNDVTVTQASTVFELAGSATATRRGIFLGAMRVGRDHIASTVYTLVLAYAGSALPLLLLFSVANRSLGDVLTSESVAIEIARSAVGGIALALSVPLTTAIAAVLATPDYRLQQLQQVGAVSGLEQRVRALGELVVVDEADPPRHFLGHADLQSLPAFDGAHVIAGVQQRVECAGVQPRGAAVEHLDRQPALVQIGLVDLGDLVFAARRLSQRPRDLDDVVVVEVQAGHRVVRLRCGRLLLDRQRGAVGGELDDAVGRRVGHPVSENRSAADILEPAEAGAQAGAVEDVVAQHQCDGVVADVVGTDHERLRQTVGLILHRVGEVDAERRPSPSSLWKFGASSAVVITWMSRMPAMISVESG